MADFSSTTLEVFQNLEVQRKVRNQFLKENEEKCQQLEREAMELDEELINVKRENQKKQKELSSILSQYSVIKTNYEIEEKSSDLISDFLTDIEKREEESKQESNSIEVEADKFRVQYDSCAKKIKELSKSIKECTSKFKTTRAEEKKMSEKNAHLKQQINEIERNRRSGYENTVNHANELKSKFTRLKQEYSSLTESTKAAQLKLIETKKVVEDQRNKYKSMVSDMRDFLLKVSNESNILQNIDMAKTGEAFVLELEQSKTIHRIRSKEKRTEKDIDIHLNRYLKNKKHMASKDNASSEKELNDLETEFKTKVQSLRKKLEGLKRPN